MSSEGKASSERIYSAYRLSNVRIYQYVYISGFIHFSYMASKPLWNTNKEGNIQGPNEASLIMPP